MTDKLTDNEIVKALECCSSGSYGCENGCPLDKDCDSPIRGAEKIMKSALDLINRQKAENDKLKNHIQEGINLAKELPEMVALAKAEAYKEFVEKLTEEIINDIHFSQIEKDYLCVMIDNLKKNWQVIPNDLH